MKLVVGCDHRGYEAKLRLLAALKAQNLEPLDVGCHSTTPVDYPDIAVLVARKIQAGHADVGILLDKSGVGMSVAANKVRGVRAALAHDEVTARVARAQNHCNVLCMGTDLVTDAQMWNIVEIFLSTPFESGRHQRRVAKLDEIMG